jgi:hypothetical protein
MTKPDPLSFYKIFMVWWPLAASSMLMSAEMPIINAGIARTPDSTAALAGFGIAFSLAIFTEAPIIMLISTAAALAKDRPAFKLIERFAVQLGIFVTVVHFVLAFTPLYDVVVRGWMGVPQAVADAALPALRILILWPAPIGWRRFHQGLLIRLRRTSFISVATIARLMITAAITFITIFGLHWGGNYAGATAVTLAVIAETLLITLVARPIAASALSADAQTALTYRQLFNFHLPLMVMSALSIVAQPLVSTGLARAPFPTESLASWPSVWGITMLISGLCQSLQETTITFAENARALSRVRRFGLTVGGIASALIAALAFTPLGDWYFGQVIALKDEVRAFANSVLSWMVAYPLLMAIELMLRGLLIRQKRTPAVRLAMGGYVVVLGVALTLGVALGLGTGVQVATVAYHLAIIGEIGLLAWQVLPLLKDIPHAAAMT